MEWRHSFREHKHKRVAKMVISTKFSRQHIFNNEIVSVNTTSVTTFEDHNILREGTFIYNNVYTAAPVFARVCLWYSNLNLFSRMKWLVLRVLNQWCIQLYAKAAGGQESSHATLKANSLATSGSENFLISISCPCAWTVCYISLIGQMAPININLQII